MCLVLCAAGLSACEAKPPPNTLIAFLLASDQSPRWVNADEPTFAKRVKQTCRGCTYLTLNAGGDAGVQAEQLDEALKQGADVIVLNPVDSERAEELVLAAGKVPVVAYDRFVAGADYYVSYDPEATGRLQAEAVLRNAGDKPRVLLINGGKYDANARAIKRARADVFGSRVTVLAELEPDTWAPDEVANWLGEQFRKTRPARIDSIVAANDGQAGAVVDALVARKIKPRDFPYLTGQDADLAALQRIIRGEQAMTVYKPIVTEAERAADIAVTLVTGGTVAGAVPVEGVPAFVFAPQAVTVDNLADTVVRDRLYTLDELCDAATLAACELRGLK